MYVTLTLLTQQQYLMRSILCYSAYISIPTLQNNGKKIMSKVIVGNCDVWLLDWSSSCFSIIEGKSNTSSQAFSFLLAETPWTSDKQKKTRLLPLNNTNWQYCVRYLLYIIGSLNSQKQSTASNAACLENSNYMAYFNNWFVTRWFHAKYKKRYSG